MLFILKSEETTSDICSRLNHETDELGRELTEHVENLRSALEILDTSEYVFKTSTKVGIIVELMVDRVGLMGTEW